MREGDRITVGAPVALLVTAVAEPVLEPVPYPIAVSRLIEVRLLDKRGQIARRRVGNLAFFDAMRRTLAVDEHAAERRRFFLAELDGKAFSLPGQGREFRSQHARDVRAHVVERHHALAGQLEHPGDQLLGS